MNLCKYKNILGEPRKGIRSFRFMDISIIDTLVTILAAIYISKKFKKPLFTTLIILFILGIIVHKIFCVRTTIDKKLFPDNLPSVNNNLPLVNNNVPSGN